MSVQLLTPTQAALQLSVSRRTIYNMIHSKRISHLSFPGSGKRRIFRISQDTVDSILKKGTADSDDNS